MRDPNDIAMGSLMGAAAVLGCALALLWSLGLATPVYVSKAEVLVQPVVTPAFERAGSGVGVNAGHERELFYSGGVAKLVRERLGTTASVAQLRSRVGVSVVGSTRILDLTYRAPSPVRPRPVLDGLVGSIVGLGAGAALAFGRARIDRRLLGRADLEEHLGAPVLATVPRVRRRRGASLVTLEQPDSRASDAYRALRIRMLALARKQPLKTVLVASATGDNGTTTVAANLAASLTQAGKEVALVSAGQGVEEAGGFPPDEMRDLLAQRGEGTDFVVVEAPPVLDTAECLALAPLVDGVLVVAAVRSTTRDDVVLARQQLDQVGAEVVGGVLSNARTPGPI